MPVYDRMSRSLLFSRAKAAGLTVKHQLDGLVTIETPSGPGYVAVVLRVDGTNYRVGAEPFTPITLAECARLLRLKVETQFQRMKADAKPE